MDIDDKHFRAYMGRNCACFNLRRAARLVSQRYDHILRQTGLTANQFSILIAACDEEGPVMSKLAKILGMERTTLTRNTAKLEKLGYLSIKPGRDKRERLVSTTRQGKDALRSATPLWQRAQEETVALVGDEKWEDMLSVLRQVSKKT